ncbi:MAG: hypothetical protein KGI83_07425 [Verrucomicrobiota bacterium]|nr:hypothetical protein [Verrucomicrobiota bacterium]
MNCPKDFYFRVDGLAMQAKEDGLEFGIEDSSTPAANSPITNGQVVGFSGDSRDYDWNPGLRVAMGFYLNHDAWQLDFAWTWVNATNYQKANSNTSLGAMLPLYALGVGTTAGAIGSRMSARWDTHYNTFDIRLGKPHYVSRYFIVNPHFGLRGGWIDQVFGVDMAGSTSNGTTPNRTIMHAKNDFWGVGARCGIDTDWVLGKGWCLFGNVAGSLLFGKFELDQSYSLPGSSADGYTINDDFYQNVPNMEIALGVGWGIYFNKKRNHIGIRAAYEFHEWWDQLNIRKFFSGSTGLPTTTPVTTGIYANDVVSRGNFTLNGFSLRVQFDI